MISSDVTKYVSFFIFRLIFACLFLHAFSNGFGDDFRKDLGRIWGDFSRNVEFLRVLIFNQFLH